MKKIATIVFLFFVFSTAFAQEVPKIVVYGPPENSRVQLEKGGLAYVRVGVLQNNPSLRGELWDVTSGWGKGVKAYADIPNFQQDVGKIFEDIFNEKDPDYNPHYPPNVQLLGNRRYLVLVYHGGNCIKWWIFTTVPPLK